MGYFKKTNAFGDKRGPAMFTRGSDRREEAHKAVCDGCGAACEVPFIPNGKKPVYCRNCYKGRATTTSFTGQPFTHAAESSREDTGTSDLKKQFSILNTKLDRLIAAVEANTVAREK